MLQNRHASSPTLAESVEAADVAAALCLAQAKDTARIKALVAASEVGSWKSLLALSAATWASGVLLGDRRLATAGQRMLAAGALASAMTMTAKRTIHRTRPNVLMDTGHYVRGTPGTSYGLWQSLPSGHAALSVAVMRAAVRAYPNLRGAVYTGAAGVAIARIFHGAHYPADVLAGSLIGFAAEGITNMITARGEDASPVSRHPCQWQG